MKTLRLISLIMGSTPSATNSSQCPVIQLYFIQSTETIFKRPGIYF